MLNQELKTENIPKAKSSKLKVVQGFSLVELLATLGIFFVISGMIFFDFQTFNSRTVLDNLAHEIALTVRQAQVFGIGVRSEDGGFPSYGTYFNLAEKKNFTLFADTYPSGNPDQKYTENDTLIRNFAIQRGNFISRICGYTSPTASCTDVDEAHVTYTRPSLEGNLTGVSFSGDAMYSYMQIFVTASDQSFSRIVTVWSNGQIAVE